MSCLDIDGTGESGETGSQLLNGQFIGDSPDKLRHTRSVAYSVELVVLKLDWTTTNLKITFS